ncbi:MAG TPA: thioredoxin-disulfide reductase [Syntrophomonadaceae bacterium]|nr:thioredoxin-disulfide reductase [Syntrophomonadaceae bacterium]HPR93421.1 thioredoxin-disulfide reductase [Syntrophomonadaceae bacterium]
MYDVIIIGSGPAGLTAAIYNGRAKLKTMVLEAAGVGGNAALTDKIDNFPGFPFGIDGSDLMDNFRKQAERFDVEIKMEEATSLAVDKTGIKILTDQNEYLSRTLIIATGAKRRQLEVPGEKSFLGRGVSYCATCDGAFFNGLPVAVVGGGDAAVKEALHLADVASHVYLIHRREGFRANETAMAKLRANERISLKLNRVVEKIEGQEFVTRLLLKDVKNQEQEFLAVDGIFISIGLVPENTLFKDFVETRDGYIITDTNMRTSQPGVFAAGDIVYKTYRQVATAVGDGALAGIAAIDYLKE